jgi:hypothetical protein
MSGRFESFADNHFDSFDEAMRHRTPNRSFILTLRLWAWIWLVITIAQLVDCQNDIVQIQQNVRAETLQDGKCVIARRVRSSSMSGFGQNKSISPFSSVSFHQSALREQRGIHDANRNNQENVHLSVIRPHRTVDHSDSQSF